MSHSDGIGWLLGQPTAIISQHMYNNFAQRVPEYVKKYTPGDLGSDYIPIRHSLFSIWISVS